ncbi:MAG: carbon monoxide dehydrogenase subunit G [Dehalococcoidia bacterium]|nr:carbon monoxide dehydrogenase subunit G [Dehalococcoidia bacterium]MDW8119084.1 carbon monoxide dehydrogenase subunit G [Chloroflexota bacterium]
MLQVKAQYELKAPRQRVWEHLLDTGTLQACIPGCERLTPSAVPDQYDVVMRVGVSAIKGTYTGKVVLTVVEPLQRYRLQVEGKGAGGFVRGEGVLTLHERGESTWVEVEGRVTLGGLLAGLGQRVAGGVARLLLDTFFACLQKRLG